MSKSFQILRKPAIFALAVCLMIAGSDALAGCGSNGSDKKEEATQSANSVEIGDKSNCGTKVSISNSTNLPARQITAKNNNNGDMTDLSITSESGIWEAGNIADVYFPKSGDNENGAGENDLIAKDSFDLLFILDDNATFTLHNVVPANLEKANDVRLEISEADLMIYLEYFDEQGPVSTLEAEKAYVEQEKAAQEKAQQEAEEQAAKAQAEADAEAATSASTSNSYAGSSNAKSGSSDTTGSSVAPSAGSGVAQSEDQCAPDAVLNY